MRISELNVTLPFSVCRDRSESIRRLSEFVPASLLERYNAVTQHALTDDDPPPLGKDKGCRVWVMCDGIYGFSLVFQPASASSWSLKDAIAVDRDLELSVRAKDGVEVSAVVNGKMREDAAAEQRANRSTNKHWSHGLDALK